MCLFITYINYFVNLFATILFGHERTFSGKTLWTPRDIFGPLHIWLNHHACNLQTKLFHYLN